VTDIIDQITAAIGECARPACERDVLTWLDPRYCSSECRLAAEHGELIGDKIGRATWGYAQKLACQQAGVFCSAATCGPGEPSTMVEFVQQALGMELDPWQQAVLEATEAAKIAPAQPEPPSLAAAVRAEVARFVQRRAEFDRLVQLYDDEHVGQPRPRWLARWFGRQR
jgi:hypothetical protein